MRNHFRRRQRAQLAAIRKTFAVGEAVEESRRELVAGRNRVVYRITPSGRRRLQGRVAAWQTIVTAVNHVLQEAEHGKPAVA